MYILHCITKTNYLKIRGHKYYGEELIKKDGFLHCSTIENFENVLPKLLKALGTLYLLVIDEERVEGSKKYEENNGVSYPHIYGQLNMSAVLMVLPVMTDANNHFVINPKLRRFM